MKKHTIIKMAFLIMGAFLSAAFPSYINLATTADLSITSYSGEEDFNLGGHPAVRIKGDQQHIAFFAFDLSSLAGEEIVSCDLVTPISATSQDPSGLTLEISTVVDTWVEGTAIWEAQTGSSCWNKRKYGSEYWLGNSAKKAIDVCHGNNGSAINSAGVTNMSIGAKISTPLDLSIVAQLRNGTAKGLALWVNDSTLKNIEMYSKESDSIPVYLHIQLAPQTQYSSVLNTTADLSLTSYSGEENYNIGGHPSVRVKGGQQHIAFFAFDLSALAGEEIASCELAVPISSSSQDPTGLTLEISTVVDNWVEGTAIWEAQTGSSCWNARKYGSENWLNNSANKAIDVCHGNNGSVVNSTGVTNMIIGTTAFVPLDPAIVADLRDGTAKGLALWVNDPTLKNIEINGKESNFTPVRLCIQFPLRTRYVSIGSRAAYTTGSITVISGTNEVYGTNTEWLDANRGKGDSIIINGIGYTVLSVSSNTKLILTKNAVADYEGSSYSIQRKYSLFADWAGQNKDIVAENINEVGVLYNDGAEFIGRGIGDWDHSWTTDESHTITLTVAENNRHTGIAGSGVVVDFNNSVFNIYPGYVTVEYLEVKNTSGLGIYVGGSYTTIKNCLIHDGTYGIYVEYDNNYDTLYNNIIYNMSNHGINVDCGQTYNPPIILNNTVYNCAGAGIRVESGDNIVVNNISIGNHPDYQENYSNALVNNCNYNISGDGSIASVCTGTGNLANVTFAQIDFADTAAASVDLHIGINSVAKNSGADLATYFVKDIEDSTRPFGDAWDIGADEFFDILPVFNSGINEYTIGRMPSIEVSVLAVTGDGPSWIVSFNNLPDLSRVFPGDRFSDGMAHSWMISNVNDEDDMITVVNSEYLPGYMNPRPSDGNDSQATVGRWFNSMQEWANARGGDLVQNARVEKGLCYNDSIFAEPLTIEDAVTDEYNYLWLTVAPNERHAGRSGAGTTVRPDKQTFSHGGFITIKSDYAVIEGLIVQPDSGDTMALIEVAGATGCKIRNNLLYSSDTPSVSSLTGIKISDSASHVYVYNNIIHDLNATGEATAIEGEETAQAYVYNNTVFNINAASGKGVCLKNVNDTCFNNISLDNGVDFDLVSGVTADFNMSSDTTASGVNSFINKLAFNQFKEIGSGNVDLHLTTEAEAIDKGLAGLYYPAIDIDDSMRIYGSTWDIGADEFSSPYTPRFKAGTHYYTIGIKTDVAITVASVSSATPWEIELGGSPDLSRIFPGDCFTDGGEEQHKWMIVAVNDSLKKIEVVNSEYAEFGNSFPSNANINQAVVGRWFHSLQAWEDTRQGDLVKDQRKEIGLCMNDGPLTGTLTIDGSNTDTGSYFILTAEASERHAGYEGSGVVLAPDTAGNAITIKDDYTIIEWLEITDWGSQSEHAAAIKAENAIYCRIRHNLIHDEQAQNNGTAIYVVSNFNVISRNIIYETGIATMQDGYYNGSGPQSVSYNQFLNNTIYNTARYGVYTPDQIEGGIFINNIVVGCGTSDYHMGLAWITAHANISSDSFVPGDSGIANVSAGDLFFSTVSGSADLHLIKGAPSIDRGWVLDSACARDIDDSVSQGSWDIGADEYKPILLFVSSSGSDPSGNGSFLLPFATVGRAYSQIPTGLLRIEHVITLLPGSYDFDSTVVLEGKNFTERENLTIRSLYGDFEQRAVLFSTAPWVSRLFEINTNHIVLKDLRIKGGKACIYPLVIEDSCTDDIKVENCLFSFDIGTDTLGIDSAAICVNNSQTTGITIRNNVFIGTHSRQGIGIKMSSAHVSVINNTFYRLERAAFFSGATLTSNEFKNNVIVSMKKGAVGFETCTGTLTIQSSLAYHSTSTGIFTDSGDSAMVQLVNCITDQDPRILSFDIESKNIGKLYFDSPCLGVGDSIGMPESDFNGTVRLSTLPFIGAVAETTSTYMVPILPLYVSVNGSDNNDGLSFYTPCATMQLAFDRIPDGLSDKQYQINIISDSVDYIYGIRGDQRCRFSDLFPLIIQSADSIAKAEIKYAQGTSINLNQLDNVTIKNLAFTYLGTSDSTQNNVAIRGCDDTASIAGAENTIVTGCLFKTDSADQINPICGLGKGSKVINSVFHSIDSLNSNVCVQQGTHGSDSVFVVNNTFIGRWNALISMDTLINTVFANNIVIGDSDQNLFIGDSAPNTFGSSNILSGLDESYQVFGLIADPDISLDPDDTLEVLYRPSDSSLCVNAGVMPGITIPPDFYGHDRLGTPDIGAVENMSISKMIYYVDAENGDDNNHGRTEDSPVRTIQAAWGKIHSKPKYEEYVITCAPGTYAPATLLGNKLFTKNTPLTIQSSLSANTDRAVVLVNDSTPGFNVQYNDHVIINKLVFKGSGNTFGNNYAVIGESSPSDQADYITVSRCAILNCDTARVRGIAGLGDSAIIKFNAFINYSDSLREMPALTCVEGGIDSSSRGTARYVLLHNTVLKWNTFFRGFGFNSGICANNICDSVRNVFDFNSSMADSVIVENCDFYPCLIDTSFHKFINSESAGFRFTDVVYSAPRFLDPTFTFEESYFGFLDMVCEVNVLGRFKPYPEFYSGDFKDIPMDIISYGNLGAFSGAKSSKIYAYGGSGNVVSEYFADDDNYVYLNHSNFPGGIGQKTYTPVSTGVIQTAGDHYYLKDHLGNTRVVFRDWEDPNTHVRSAKMTEIIDYYAFGKEQKGRDWDQSDFTAWGANKVTERFTGKEFDDDGFDEELGTKGLGLNYFGARYYDPEIGRWMSTDPMEEYYSPYVYCGNDPINLIDPDGMQTPEQRQAAVSNAEEYVEQNPNPSSTQYEWGKKGGPGEKVDCSGLVTGSYGSNYSPPAAGDAAGTSSLWKQTIVRVGEPIKGDLVFFYEDHTHVGIVTEVTESSVKFIHSGTSTGPIKAEVNRNGTGYWAERQPIYRQNPRNPSVARGY